MAMFGVLFLVAASAFTSLTDEDKTLRQQQQAAHTPQRSPTGEIRCGTVIPDVHDVDAHHNRRLAKTDCTMSYTNPLQSYSPASGPIYRIKTVVHVISDGTAGLISRSCVEDGIEWLNRDFRAVAGSKVAGSVDTRIEFVLTDVKYHDNSQWQNQDHGTAGGFWSVADVHNYMNIFIKTPPGGILGQANLAQYAGGSVDGITVGTSVWGSCATSGTYNQGATATHEVGHYLGLLHTFNQGQCYAGDVETGIPKGCNVNGDLICDTSPEASPVYDCDSRGTCNAVDPVHNFMDYSHDACLTRFTEEQARRMRCSVSSYRPLVYNIVTSGWTAPPPAASPPPPPPHPPAPPPASCTCRDFWAYNVGSVTVQVNGCGNPDNDPNGNWCASNEGAGCRAPITGAATTAFWFYCTISDSPPPPKPSPPPPPVPTTAVPCTCEACWLYQGIYSTGCANPDNDRGGTWCKTDQGRGCIKPNGHVAQTWYGSCSCTTIRTMICTWTHTCCARQMHAHRHVGGVEPSLVLLQPTKAPSSFPPPYSLNHRYMYCSNPPSPPTPPGVIVASPPSPADDEYTGPSCIPSPRSRSLSSRS